MATATATARVAADARKHAQALRIQRGYDTFFQFVVRMPVECAGWERAGPCAVLTIFEQDWLPRHRGRDGEEVTPRLSAARGGLPLSRLHGRQAGRTVWKEARSSGVKPADFRLFFGLWMSIGARAQFRSPVSTTPFFSRSLPTYLANATSHLLTR